MRQRLMILAVALLATRIHAEVPVDFSGAWVVSNDRATDADNTASDSSRSTAGHGMGSHGGRGGMGGGGRHGHQPQSAASSGDAGGSGAPADPRLHARTLIIRQSDVVFDVAADGTRMAYRFDNRNNYGAPYGGTVNLTWAEPEMVIETHPDGGGVIEEHYVLSRDGKRMSLDIRTQRAGEDTAHEIRRVFVRDDGAATAAPAIAPGQSR
jgi:hypothetical protein